MKKYPNVSLKVIFRYRSEVMMFRHHNGAFDFPGGRMEWKESIFGALNREIKEELNFPLKKEPELFSVWNYISKDRKRHSVMIHFIYPLDKKPKFSSPERVEILWLTGKELFSKNIIRDKKFINKIYEY